jgi:hypothetical protein
MNTRPEVPSRTSIIESPHSGALAHAEDLVLAGWANGLALASGCPAIQGGARGCQRFDGQLGERRESRFEGPASRTVALPALAHHQVATGLA